MTRALILTLEIEDPAQLPDIATEVANELNALGLQVVSVKPWDSADPSASGSYNSAVIPQ